MGVEKKSKKKKRKKKKLGRSFDSIVDADQGSGHGRIYNKLLSNESLEGKSESLPEKELEHKTGEKPPEEAAEESQVSEKSAEAGRPKKRVKKSVEKQKTSFAEQLPEAGVPVETAPETVVHETCCSFFWYKGDTCGCEGIGLVVELLDTGLNVELPREIPAGSMLHIDVPSGVEIKTANVKVTHCFWGKNCYVSSLQFFYPERNRV